MGSFGLNGVFTDDGLTDGLEMGRHSTQASHCPFRTDRCRLCAARRRLLVPSAPGGRSCAAAARATEELK